MTPLPVTKADIEAWRALMTRVRGVVEQGRQLRLLTVAQRAYRAVLPLPPYDRTNPFERLADAAKQFATDDTPLGRHTAKNLLASNYRDCLRLWPDVFDSTSRPGAAAQRERHWIKRRDIGDVD